MQPVLAAKKITKTFSGSKPLTILKDIDLELYPQKSYSIIGKSGEGKTTLLHILGTLDSPTSGSLEICGKNVLEMSSNVIRNQHIGFVFQAFHLLLDATVLENVLMPLKIARKDVSHTSLYFARAQKLIEQVGLHDRMHELCFKLSGGEKQRVAIARAFVQDPDIIFADEPTGNLDHATARDVQELLLRCVEEEKKTLLVVTHNLELAKLMSACYELEDTHLNLRSI
jgi:lipoprotein-releasing system ATP-binding protein